MKVTRIFSTRGAF